MRWLLLSAFLASAGCFFQVDGLKAADDTGGGNATDDLADGTPGDMPGGAVDMAVSQPGDMATTPPDLTPPFTPSHISSSDFQLGTQPLTIMTSIRTDSGNLLVDGAPAPAGVSFAVENGLAVLAASQVTVPSGATVRVTGALPLVIVSRSSISIAGTLDASAHGTQPGAGGSGSSAGPGKGTNGASDNGGAASGGSGARYGRNRGPKRHEHRR